MIRVLDESGWTIQAATSLGTHLRDSLRKLWRRYRKRFKRCRKKFSEEAVHQLRIETRRLLSKLDLLAALIPDARVDQARRLLKKRLDTFDPLRDTQVQLQAVELMRPRFPEAKAFRDTLVRREHVLARKIRRRLKGSGSRKLAKAVDRLSRQIKRTLTGDRRGGRTHAELVAIVEAAFDHVLTLQHAIDPKDTATIHKTRVAFKKFRYMVESLQRVLPGVTDAQLEAMQAYQTRMGQIQDVEVLLAGLKWYGHKRASTKTLEHLRTSLVRRRATLVRQYLRSADQLLDFWPPNPHRPRMVKLRQTRTKP